MSEDKNWNDLSKSEKDKTKATATAAGFLFFFSLLNSSGKWSVARWWFIFYLLICIDVRVTEIPGYTVIWAIIGVTVLYIFRKKSLIKF